MMVGVSPRLSGILLSSAPTLTTTHADLMSINLTTLTPHVAELGPTVEGGLPLVATLPLGDDYFAGASSRHFPKFTSDRTERREAILKARDRALDTGCIL